MGIADWDQRLFAWVWRGARGLGATARRLGGQEPDAASEHTVALVEIAPKLRLLAAALSGSTLDVRAAEAVSGHRGDVILLPRTLAVGESPETAAQVYLFGLVYQLASRDLGLHLSAEASPPEVPSWLAMFAILDSIACELPGARALLKELTGPLLEVRPDPEGLSGRDLALEIVLRRVLDVPLERDVPPEIEAWVESLEAAGERLLVSSPESRGEHFETACESLVRSFDSLGEPGSAEPLLPFGLLRPRSPQAAPVKAEPTPPSALASGTEREGKSKEVVRRVHLDDRPHADNPLVHSFEKVHTAEEYKGGQKALDGTDEIDDHLEALEELDMREVIRTRERTNSIFRADALLDGSAPELNDATPEREPDFQYDEWDEKKRVYRRGHCNLYLERSRAVRADAAARWVKDTLVARRRELRRLEQELAQINLERRPMRRQRDGGEVDIDAVVAAKATLAAGHTPSDRLYVNRRPKEPTLSLLLLLDISLSSDAYVAEERVLDVSREAAFVVGEALGDSVHLAVAGFHSNTRRDCRFVTIKTFGERWRDARGRLVGLEPQGYTRIGPALRHGTSILRLNDTRSKVMVVVTDGQPTDYDRYEGRHGVADVRQAIREAEREGVACFALAVSKDRRPQLGQMFGLDRYSLLQRGSQLPDAMGTLLAELVRG